MPQFTHVDYCTFLPVDKKEGKATYGAEAPWNENGNVVPVYLDLN